MEPCKRIEGCGRYDECPRDYCVNEKSARKTCPERGILGFLKRDYHRFLSRLADDNSEAEKRQRA